MLHIKLADVLHMTTRSYPTTHADYLVADDVNFLCGDREERGK